MKSTPLLPTTQELRTQFLQHCSPACPLTYIYNRSIIREITQAYDLITSLPNQMCYIHRGYILRWLDSQRYQQDYTVLFILYGLGYSRHYSRSSDTSADSLGFDIADMADFPPLPTSSSRAY
ncbi:hypothetical protein Alg130_04748 [Pyrenophora tritici-repentis]|nr:hypothetical protein Alg130_04748 [Pyrenophora tritici-repentis]